MKKNLNPLLLFCLCLLLIASCSPKNSEESNEDVDTLAAEGADDNTVHSSHESSVADHAAASSAPDSNTYTDDEGVSVYLEPEEKPVFTGGEKAMENWLSKNLSYPKDGIEEGTVYVEFVVGESGKIRSSKVTQGPEDAALRSEALSTVNSMPSWIPGKQDGKPVHTRYLLPITFRKL